MSEQPAGPGLRKKIRKEQGVINTQARSRECLFVARFM
jgi:hypothetical protein